MPPAKLAKKRKKFVKKRFQRNAVSMTKTEV